MTETATGVEITWCVDGLTLAGLAFGPPGGRRVLALHGWLDNAASFEMLASRLPDCRVVALDLTGHGLSDNRSADATYHIWDDIPQVAGVLDELGWDSCVLLAHSRGASVATILAAAMPDRIEALIALDWLLPQPEKEADAVKQFRSFLDDKSRLSNRPERRFPSSKDYLDRRARNGVTADLAARLATRALQRKGDDFVLRGDRRLRGASAVKLTQGQADAFLRGLSMPVLWLVFDQGLARHPWFSKLTTRAQELAADLTIQSVAGHHHCHMESEPAQEIAGIVTAFLGRHAGPGT